jgi:hypothetical protein
MRRQNDGACKGRASYLKPKEIAPMARHFNLPGEPNCLKVKMIAKAGLRAAVTHPRRERWQA